MPRAQLFRLGKIGLARVLGDLEAQVMEVLWSSQQALPVQKVCDSLGPNSNYKTIMTVLGRLVVKGLLERHREGRAYFYRPLVSQDAFLKSVADGVMQGLIQDYGDVAVSSFIHAMETASPESLAKLEQLLEHRRLQSSQEHRGEGEESQ